MTISASRSLILLDRDGVINEMIVDDEHGTVDSPLHPSQVKLCADVPDAIASLTHAGFGVAIVTNQPSAAKGKTTRLNLEAVHRKVVESAESKGGKILSSHICFHRQEDGCDCRKPKTGLLRDAFTKNPTFTVSGSWMVGDGITDIVAGSSFGVMTAFLAFKKCDACKIFENTGVVPTFWGDSLNEFVKHLLSSK